MLGISPPGLNAAQIQALLQNRPIMLSVKNVVIPTAGAPIDIATILIPAEITRWRTCGTNAAGSNSIIIAETAAGTLAGASFTAWDAAGGTGVQLQSSVIGPTAAGIGVAWAAQSSVAFSVATSIFIRQTANSANAGTASFYILIFPIN